MKVAQVNVSDFGSTGRIMLQIRDRLKKEGHECICFYGRGREPDASDKVLMEGKMSVYCHAAKARLFDKMGHGSTAATKKLVERLEQEKPDILHLHNIHGYYLDMRVLFDWIKKTDIKTVWTLHDCWAFTGGCAYFLDCGCEKWRTGCRSCPQTGNYPKRYSDHCDREYELKKGLFNGVGHMILTTPSEWMAGLVKQSFLSPYEVIAVPNGIDTGVFYPRNDEERLEARKKLGISDKDKMVLAVANVWDERKRLGAFEQLAKALEPRGVKSVVVGVTEAQKKDLSGAVTALTRTENQQQLAELYSAADLFVSTSVEESFSLVVAEALASGTPVVTADGGGCSELISEDTGLIVPRDDGEALLKAAEQILFDGKDYTGACRDRCLNNYSLDHMLDGYMEVYGRLYGG